MYLKMELQTKKKKKRKTSTYRLVKDVAEKLVNDGAILFVGNMAGGVCHSMPKISGRQRSPSQRLHKQVKLK